MSKTLDYLCLKIDNKIGELALEESIVKDDKLELLKLKYKKEGLKEAKEIILSQYIGYLDDNINELGEI